MLYGSDVDFTHLARARAFISGDASAPGTSPGPQQAPSERASVQGDFSSEHQHDSDSSYVEDDTPPKEKAKNPRGAYKKKRNSLGNASEEMELTKVDVDFSLAITKRGGHVDLMWYTAAIDHFRLNASRGSLSLERGGRAEHQTCISRESSP